MITIQELPKGRVMRSNGEFVCGDSSVIRAYYRHALSGFHGRVLTAGLGLGVALEYLCSLPAVESVDCVEIDFNVISELGYIPGKATIICAGIWAYDDKEYDCAFLDIWPDYAAHREDALRLEAMKFAPVQVSLPLTYEEVMSSL